MKRVLLACVASVAIGGCATVSDVVPTGKNSYMVSMEVRGGLTSDSSVRAKTMLRANQYCDGLGKHFVLDHVQSRGVRGWTPQDSEIYFLCLAEDDPDYQNTHVRKDPNAVIEVRQH